MASLEEIYKQLKADKNPYALNTDTQQLKAIYDQATAAAQTSEAAGITAAENAFQRNLATTQATALDTIRKNNAAAIATGASKGMQAANELSAILGLQDTAVEEATALAQERLSLADKYAALYAENAVKAREAADANAQTMLGQAAALYGYDTQVEAQKAATGMEYNTYKQLFDEQGQFRTYTDSEGNVKSMRESPLAALYIAGLGLSEQQQDILGIPVGTRKNPIVRDHAFDEDTNSEFHIDNILNSSNNVVYIDPNLTTKTDRDSVTFLDSDTVSIMGKEFKLELTKKAEVPELVQDQLDDNKNTPAFFNGQGYIRGNGGCWWKLRLQK